jgi:hypothetical protein
LGDKRERDRERENLRENTPERGVHTNIKSVCPERGQEACEKGALHKETLERKILVGAIKEVVVTRATNYPPSGPWYIQEIYRRSGPGQEHPSKIPAQTYPSPTTESSLVQQDLTCLL